jgi:predicted RNase H-like HicB family nuclease
MERHHFILSDYVEHALAAAVYDKLEDGSFAGRIPGCVGVLAFAESLRECEAELRSTLEDWILVGLKLDHELPVLNGIDLNREPALESMDAA